MEPTPKKILIVDDDTNLREIYVAMFTQEGFETRAAQNGKEAWELLEAGTFFPDVVFTGIVMPEMDGFTLIMHMRQDPRFVTLPVAIFSHRGLAEHEERARQLAINEFIVQSTTPPFEVVRRIKLLVGLQKNLRILLPLDREENNSLLHMLNAQHHTSCPINVDTREVILELITDREKGTFSLKPLC
ncbi:MAG: LuxR family transcriptional regulator [Parcubacteria group bacterium Gr01-1014_66]|nr:MAG: LuxR family transcriptional regulator [Parcubacteria group bacterium Gr01-1014_66]